jgi:hypothetical protein
MSYVPFSHAKGSNNELCPVFPRSSNSCRMVAVEADVDRRGRETSRGCPRRGPPGRAERLERQGCSYGGVVSSRRSANGRGSGEAGGAGGYGSAECLRILGDLPATSPEPAGGVIIKDVVFEKPIPIVVADPAS